MRCILASIAERPIAPTAEEAVIAPRSHGNDRVTWLLNLAFVVFIPVAGAILAVATLFRGTVQPIHWWLFGVGFLLTGLGITVGYHRLATHRSFETNPVVKAIL